MLMQINPPPWTAWNQAGTTGQPTRPSQAAPGSSLAGPEAEHPDPMEENAAGAPAIFAAARPSDLPATRRVSSTAGGELPEQPADRRPRDPAAGGTGQGRLDIYV